MTKDAILAALPLLQPSELKAIKMAADALISSGGNDALPATHKGPQVWLYEALQASLNCGQMPYVTYIKSSPGKNFVKNAPKFIAFIEKYFPESLKDKTTGIAIMRFLIGLMLIDLKARQIKPHITTMVNVQLPYIADIFDRQFPDYLNSGAAQMVAKQLGA